VDTTAVDSECIFLMKVGDKSRRKSETCLWWKLRYFPNHPSSTVLRPCLKTFFIVFSGVAFKFANTVFTVNGLKLNWTFARAISFRLIKSHWRWDATLIDCSIITLNFERSIVLSVLCSVEVYACSKENVSGGCSCGCSFPARSWTDLSGAAVGKWGHEVDSFD
jgi:hypothetical protein